MLSAETLLVEGNAPREDGMFESKEHAEKVNLFAKAIGKGRDLAKSERLTELEQLVSRVAPAIHHIGATLAPEAVELVC